MIKLRCIYIQNLWNELALSLKIVLWSRLNLLFFICSPIIVIGTKFHLLNEASCFILAGLALIPCAERLSLVTEHIAERTNGTIGALLNATFGNAPELLISSAALRSGFYRLVQLTLLGSILTNLMFVFGLSSLIGGLRWQRQRIRITSGNVLIGMLLLALIGVVLPATLKLAHESSIGAAMTAYNSTSTSNNIYNGGQENSTHSMDSILTASELQCSRINAIIMIGAYILFILFQLGTHKEEFDYTGDEYAVFGGGHNIVRVPGMQPHAAAIHHPPHLPPEASYNLFCLDLGFRSLFALCDKDLQFSNKLHRTLHDTSTSTIKIDAHTDPPPPPSLEGEIQSLSPTISASPSSEERLFRRSPSKSKVFYDRLSIASMSETSPMEDDKKRVRTFFDSSSSPCDEERVILDHENHPHPTMEPIEEGPFMSLKTALIWLGLITTAISSLSDVLVDTIDGFAHRFHLSEVFISVIIVPYFSNIAEQVSAIIFAFRNKMDLCIGVTVGSAAQVALFILPGTVLVGWYMDHPMSLYFRAYETVCFLLSVICIGSVLQGGSTNWMSGLVFVCIYFMIAGGFLFHEDERLSWETQIAHNNTSSVRQRLRRMS